MNWWIAIKAFFNELPYDKLGDIGTFILSVASVFTAIVTAIILCKQYNIQKETLVYQKLSEQPIFNIYYELIDADNDSKYETEILNISNEGHLFKQINSISVSTIFDFAINNKHYLLKTNGYFFGTTKYQNLKGLIYKSRGNNNNEKFHNLYIEVLKNSKVSERFYEVVKFNLIKISYIDIHNNHCAYYLKDRIYIDETTYNSILDQIVNKQDIIDIDKITFDGILNIIENDRVENI